MELDWRSLLSRFGGNLRRYRVAYVVLALALVLTGVAFLLVWNNVRAQEDRLFDETVTSTGSLLR